MSTSPGLALRLSDFGWRYPGRTHWAVRHIDLQIDAGERVLIAGASGSGKSTLLRCLARLVELEDAAEASGTIEYFDNLRSSQPLDDAAVRAGIGLMLQSPDTNLLMTRVGDDVAFGLENAQLPATAIWPRVHQVLTEVGFPYSIDRPTGALSGGEKQRVALAGLVAREPRLLILDEPTANLDPAGAKVVTGALAHILDRTGSTMVLVEHQLSQVIDLIDRVVLVSPNGIEADGKPAEVLRKHAKQLRRSGIFVPGWRPEFSAPQQPQATSVVLSAKNVTVERGPEHALALADVSLDIHAGTATAIVGHNGAGKSTLARVLGGLLKPTHGAAHAPGVAKPLHKVRSKQLAALVGSVFQDPEHQFVTSTVREELAIGAHATGARRQAAEQRADGLLRQLGLTHLARANPYTLSGGEKRRLAVAAALVANPPVLILDEPTFGQDSNSWSTIAALLVDQLVRGTALVLVTHDLELVRTLNARVVTLERGRLTESEAETTLATATAGGDHQ